MKTEKISVRDNILGCASHLVGQDGAGHLTLDRVAKAAGLSKGGLLYHFPNKRSLIEGMIEKFLHNMETKLAAKAEILEGTSNKALVGFVQVISEHAQSRLTIAVGKAFYQSETTHLSQETPVYQICFSTPSV